MSFLKISPMPCGFQPTGSLQDLGHYRKCDQSDCKSRATMWDNLKAQAADPIKAILSKPRKLTRC